FTDYDQAPLRLVSRSAEANGFDPSNWNTELLDWRALPQSRYDLILGADVLYERRLVPLVANLMANMLTESGEGWVAGPYRTATEDLESHLARQGLRAHSEPISADGGALGPLRGTLHRIVRCD